MDLLRKNAKLGRIMRIMEINMVVGDVVRFEHSNIRGSAFLI